MAHDTDIPASELSQLFEEIASRFKALGNPLRLKILNSLKEGERSVNDILDAVGGSQANISKHLNVLRQAQLVGFRRDGVTVYYRIADEAILSICRSVCDSLLIQANAEVDRIARARAALLGESLEKGA